MEALLRFTDEERRVLLGVPSGGGEAVGCCGGCSRPEARATCHWSAARMPTSKAASQDSTAPSHGTG